MATVTCTCQHSGIQFEAQSKRALNHPQVSKRLNDMAKRGILYSLLLTALKLAREEGGYTDIEGYMQIVDRIFAGQKAANDRSETARRQAQEEVAAQMQQRRRQDATDNNLLKQHGYTWRKYAVGTEDDSLPGSYYAGVGEFSHHEWELCAPDGRPISKKDALNEIANGVTYQKGLPQTTLSSIKVWENPGKKETRIYVETVDRRTGCLYLTGNPWKKQGVIEGQLTEAEWQVAREIGLLDDKWHTVHNIQALRPPTVTRVAPPQVV